MAQQVIDNVKRTVVNQGAAGTTEFAPASSGVTPVVVAILGSLDADGLVRVVADSGGAPEDVSGDLDVAGKSPFGFRSGRAPLYVGQNGKNLAVTSTTGKFSGVIHWKYV